mmetsp:Transcript_30526/g.74909  ORF Transcript_30526/g.74909 Transcript_30526/m.74909 type:complete len:376 (-) Transcript_30526:206-1333(-)
MGDSEHKKKSFDSKAFAEHVTAMLEKHTVAELPLLAPVFLSESVEPVEAFKFLSEHGLRACPVRADSEEGVRIIGMMDQRDAVIHATETHKAKCQDCKNHGLFQSLSFKANSFKSHDKPDKMIPQRVGSFASMTPKKVQDEGVEAGGIRLLARNHKFCSFPPSARLLQVADAMANGEYVVGVMGGPPENAGLKGLIDQVAFIGFLAPIFQDVHMPVKAVCKDFVVPVKTGEMAIKAFETMVNKGSSGIAVVDEAGVVMQNCSTSDVRIFYDEGCKMEILHLPVEEFLSRKATHKETKAHAKTKAPISVCHAEDDIAQVVTKLVKTGYHRVWVVDLDRKPIGLLSLTDLFRKVSKVMKTLASEGTEQTKSDACAIL